MPILYLVFLPSRLYKEARRLSKHGGPSVPSLMVEGLGLATRRQQREKRIMRYRRGGS